jgi:hypothetical protein
LAAPQSYLGSILQEFNARAGARGRLKELDDNDDAKVSSERSKESLRRLLRAKKVTALYPEECVKDFA